MLVERKTFNGGLNTDSSDFVIKADQYRNAVNMRILTSDNGKAGSAQNVLGNILITDNTGLNDEQYIPVGAYEDEKGSTIYSFWYHPSGRHLIKQYDKSTGEIKIVLDNNLFIKDGINKGLNFTKTFITGITMVGRMLFWAGPIPRRINISRLLSGQYAGIFDDDFISIIRRPPNIPPILARIVTGNKIDLIKNNAFQFTCRYVYYDGETSVFSPYSTLANYGADTDKNNAIRVTLPAENVIKQDVRFIEIAMRYGNTGNLFIIKRWDKKIAEDAVAIQSGNLSFDFYNDNIGEAVGQSDEIKPFENIPLECRCIESAENRIFLANNKFGYDTPGTCSLSLSASTTIISVEGQKIMGSWAWADESYHSGFLGKNIHHRRAWFLYISGYDGIKPDGYYAVKGVDGSETRHNSYDPIPDSWFSFPNPVNYADLDYIGLTLADIKNYYALSSAGTRRVSQGWTSHSPSTIVGAATSNSFTPIRIFKSKTSYNAGIVYYDQYMRCCDVVINDNSRIATKDVSYNNINYTNNIQWALSNNNTINDIPEWAVYYGIVINKSLRTRNFMQTYPYEISYVSKDATGIYATEKKPYNPSFAGIQIDITSLSSDSLGYIFNRNDIVNIYLESGNSLFLPVIDQYGKYIVCSLADIGDLTNTANALIEIYTPYKAASIEPYFEIAQIFAISNPGTTLRAYSITEGFINGDAWLVLRQRSSVSAKAVEAMSPNDKHYQDWFTDAGRLNTLPQPGLGQSVKEGNIIVSDPYIPQTLINGLCSFDAVNTKDIPDSCGAINKLVYTSKVQAEPGGVMLAVCVNKTVSIYIGETRIQTESGNNFLAASPGIIGTLNILRGGYGCINPESIVEKDGNVYFLDRKRGKVARYATNGIFAISDYEMKNFFDKRCKQLSGLTNQELADLGIDAICCYGGFDGYNNEYLLFMPAVKKLPDFLEDVVRKSYQFNININSENPANTPCSVLSKLKFYGGSVNLDAESGSVTIKYGTQILLDNVTFSNHVAAIPNFRPYKSNQVFTVTAPIGNLQMIINELQPNAHEFDNGGSKLLAFKEGYDRWQASNCYGPGYLISIDNDLYSFKNGKMYQHGKGAYNTFYDETYPTQIVFISNENAAVPHLFNFLIVDANQAPDYVHIRIETAGADGLFYQSSDLTKDDFDIEEGCFYATIFFDRLSPNANGSYEQKMKNGDIMQGQTASILIEFNEYKNPIELKSVAIGYDQSAGHII